MTNKELQKLVEQLSLSHFYKPFLHQASFNNRLRTTGGRYLLRSHDIEVNPRYLSELGLNEIIGIIKHELCHYHLHLEGKGYQHRDKDFRELLEAVDAPRFCSPLETQQIKSKVHLYQCSKCQLTFRRRRRMNTARYICGRCSGAISHVKTID
ncbi:SprT family protein [Bacillus lacus]|uniref:Protein SprT-like n=1 Tax=Metabacillus lacus TaxID=1983721 RepID=A0A7X2IYD0_9BACI|nr:SprT family protein [Metabacillus lacus]MRX72078.1 SprT family protein [Metabacillus lacus]